MIVEPVMNPVVASSLPARAPSGAIVRTLRAENAALALGAVVAFHAAGGHWTLFAWLFLIPDISILGYIAGPVPGARCYNLGHSYLPPALLGGLGWWIGHALPLHLALIWMAHIGFDRALGYGLKYREGFAETHLSRLAPRKP